MTAGHADEAYQLLVDVSRKNLNSPQVFKMLAQAAGTSEHPLQTHAAMSQYYFLNGFTNQAIEQLKLAAKTPGVTDYQTARIQARIQALEELLETKASE
jgi:predicted Zn-dependent protease